jgi:MBOAT, membrane-bound O-acyltransferase family
MSFWLALAFPVAVALAVACSFALALGLSKRRRLAVLGVVELLVLLTPLLVSLDRPFARFLAGVLAVALAAKLFDLHLGASLGDRPSFRDVFTYLINLTSVVRRKLAEEPRPGVRADLRRLALATLATVPGGFLFVACYMVDWRPIPFVVEHSAKVFAFFLILVPGAAAGAAIWRLLGGWTREPMNNPFASTTPADFWRRYNRAAQQFLLEDVFKPLGGMRRPVFATLTTFVVSGLIHEFLFDITVLRVQGYQMAFFLIQGIAVVLTARLDPKGWWRGVGIAATLAFNLAAGALFFASVDEVLPFYQRR